MNQQEVEAWIAQQGGPSAVQHSVEKRTVPNPAFAMTLPNGDPNPQYQPGSPATIQVSSEKWVNSKTTATLHVARKDDGSFDVIENQGADPNKPTTGATEVSRAAEAKAKRDREESEVNAALPKDQDPRYETNEARAKRAQETIDRQGRDAKAAEDKARQDKADEDRRAQQNRPTVTIKEDGSGGMVSISTDPRTGQSTTAPIPGVRGTPDRVTVDGVVYERGKDGAYAPAAGIPAPRKGGKLPPGVNPPQFSRGNVAKELARFQGELDAAVGPDGITKEEAIGFYAPYHQEAQTFISELSNADTQDQNAVGQQLTQRGQGITQAGNRMNWSNSAFQNAAQQDQNLIMGAAGTGKSALVPLLTLQAGLANAAGGFKNQPEVEVRRYPEIGKPVPASIAPVINATSTAPSGVAAGTQPTAPPAALLPPKPPVSAPQSAAVAAQAAAAPVSAPGPSAPKIRFRNQRTGEVKEMTPVELDALPDVADWQPLDPNAGAAVFTPQQGNAQSAATPIFAPRTGNIQQAATPTLSPPPPEVAPFQDDQRAPGQGGDLMGDPNRPMPQAQPYANPSGMVEHPPMQMLPRSIQPAMPQQQQGPDIEAITAKMLADGVDPQDVMAVRQRWSRQAA